VERLAVENGLSVQMLKQVVHEHDQDDNPIPGLLVVLRRAASSGPEEPSQPSAL
jgi:hypothetical protein